MRPLIDLIRVVPETLDIPAGAAAIPVHNLTTDSRNVKPGSLFVALKGEKIDGAKFIPEAIQNGAAAVLCDPGSAVPSGVIAISSQNPRKALAHMAAAFYETQPAHMVAVTGTDGKTSTCDFFRQILSLSGKKSASIGTLGVRGTKGEELFPGTHTTPDAVTLHRMLAEMSRMGITHAAMEASSHGLHQYRMDGVKLQAAAFTNLGRDHFDYHKTESEYFSAKVRLFSELLPKGATAVLNADDARFSELKEICSKRGHKIVAFGKTGAQYRLESLEPTAHGQKAKVILHGKAHVLNVPLAGSFQVMNILAALALAEAVGENLEHILSTLPKLGGVPGRLELATTLANGAAAYVDYAHTPLALANILKTLRPHAKGHLHVVFGCGGDRDPGKRPQMGRIAADLADVAIVTDDNPRSEDPAAIRRAIMAECKGGKEIADRREAIYVALKGLSAGDVLVIAGKGHEKTQIVGDRIFPFDDVAVARDAAKELKLV